MFWSLFLPKPEEFELGLKCSEFFALARNALALLPTPLLRRFFSPVPVLSGDGRPLPGLLPLRLSLMGAFSEAGGDGVVELGGDMLASVEVGGEMAIPLSGSCKVSFGGEGELELLPNILFSNPPWEEKLLLCLPASVLSSL
jgi:hypothetical protein